ncbi:MAG: (2Fe-2S) ferredoxin domain-containing protein [Clostridia bacterium]|nr:(2Fe-2S) ferredoxin domain-containing protein [Clostridia bacterium]
MKTPAELAAIRAAKKYLVATREDNSNAIRVTVSMGTSGLENGARAVSSAFVEEIYKANMLDKAIVVLSDTMGDAENEPRVTVEVPGAPKVTYVKMDAAKAAKVVAEHIVNNNVVTDYTK